MKQFLTAIFLLTTCIASAQIVNIPDPVFKSLLLNNPSVNTNGDNEIQQSEASVVGGLIVNPTGSLQSITDLTGIEAFSNMTALECNHCGLTTAGALSSLPNLQILRCEINNLTSLAGIQSLTNLKYLFCDNNNITTLDVSGMSQLQMLSCNNNPISTVDFAGCNNLSTLNLDATQLSYFDLTVLPALNYCSFSSLIHMTELHAEGAPKLMTLVLSSNNIEYANFKNCDSLRTITFGGDTIRTLDVSGSAVFSPMLDGASYIDSFIARRCLNMGGLRSESHPIRRFFDVTGSVNLQYVTMNIDSLPSFDFSSCTALRLLSLTGFLNRKRDINIKNGTFTGLDIQSLFFQHDSINICADDFEVDSLNNYIAQMHQYDYPIYPNINSYCSFFPGGNYNTIKGKVKVDINNNGCDMSDPPLNGLPVRFTDASGSSAIRYSFIDGRYDYYTYAGNYTVQPYFAYPYFNISPLTSNVIFDTANNLIDSVNFCVSPNGIHNDLAVTVIPTWPPARPGFTAGYQIIYKNNGNTTLSGNVQLNFDNGKMNFNNASTTVSNQSPGQLTWNYNNLLPFESRTISLRFDLLPPPINNVGDTILFLANINPVVNDETPNNNSFILPQGIRSSYDPNDKICLEGEKVDINNKGNPLDYIIHFQNLGTDTAFNIVVADRLSDKYDWNTVEITGSSHPFELREKDGKLEFIFENIKLPYAAINEPASHGFVAFKVKPKSTLLIGDSLNNKASIYFDFNLPVVTNLATTVVVPSSSLAVKLEYFSLINKNETNQLVWKVSSTTGITDFAIERSNDGIHFTNIGNITASVERCQSPFNFSDEKPFDGKTYYRIHIKDANEISFYSKILVAERTKSGLSIITAVVSNQNNTTLYLNASKEQNVQMKIIAADGRLVYNQTKTIAVGSSTMNLSLKNLSTGIYTLVVYTNDGEVVTKRFVK